MCYYCIYNKAYSLSWRASVVVVAAAEEPRLAEGQTRRLRTSATYDEEKNVVGKDGKSSASFFFLQLIIPSQAGPLLILPQRAIIGKKSSLPPYSVPPPFFSALNQRTRPPPVPAPILRPLSCQGQQATENKIIDRTGLKLGWWEERGGGLKPEKGGGRGGVIARSPNDHNTKKMYKKPIVGLFLRPPRRPVWFRPEPSSPLSSSVSCPMCEVTPPLSSHLPRLQGPVTHKKR